MMGNQIAVLLLFYLLRYTVSSKIITRSMIYTPDEIHGNSQLQDKNSTATTETMNHIHYNHTRKGKDMKISETDSYFTNFQPVILPNYDSNESVDTPIVNVNSEVNNVNHNIGEALLYNKTQLVTKLHIIEPSLLNHSQFKINTTRSAKFVNNTFYPLDISTEPYNNGYDNIDVQSNNTELVSLYNFVGHNATSDDVANNFVTINYINPKHSDRINDSTPLTHQTLSNKSLDNLLYRSLNYLKSIFSKCSSNKTNLICIASDLYHYGSSNVVTAFKNNNLSDKSIVGFIELFTNIYKCIWEVGVLDCNLETFIKREEDYASNNSFSPEEEIAQTGKYFGNDKGTLRGKHKWMQMLIFLLFKLKIILLPIVTGLAVLSGKALSISFMALLMSILAGSSQRLSDMWQSDALKRHEVHPQISDYKASTEYYM